MTDEIALFIDFENIRYSLINVQRREPDPQELIALARRFGTVMVARAYADWSRQPEFFKGSLTAAMIDRVDCPSKVRERFRQAPQFQHQGPYVPGSGPVDEMGGDRFASSAETPMTELNEADDEAEAQDAAEAEGRAGEAGEAAPPQRDEAEAGYERRPRFDAQGPYGGNGGYGGYANGGGYGGYANGGGYGNNGGGYGGNGGGYGNSYGPPTPVITQSTVDLNMLMDMIETVFDRPTINTFILMSGDRDFTRIAARLKLRLNKRVIVVGVPGTVSRDLIAAAEQFIPLGVPFNEVRGGYHQQAQGMGYGPAQGPVEPDEPGFIQFLDYIDKHWSWRTVGGVANFIGDPYNPKNRFRGRLTRDSARDLLRCCIDEGILIVQTDPTGSENLRLNRSHPSVEAVLTESPMR